MNKIEEVAEAIRKTNETAVGLTFKELTEAMARAAIAAMEKPTEGMTRAAMDTLPFTATINTPAGARMKETISSDEFDAAWSAAIRAALSEDPS